MYANSAVGSQNLAVLHSFGCFHPFFWLLAVLHSVFSCWLLVLLSKKLISELGVAIFSSFRETESSVV